MQEKAHVDGHEREDVVEYLAEDDCKSKGAGIMLSDFISEQNGYLRLTDEEFVAGQEQATC